MPPNGQVSWLDATASGLLTRLIEVAHFAVEFATSLIQTLAYPRRDGFSVDCGQLIQS